MNPYESMIIPTFPGFGGIWISWNPGNRPKIVFKEHLQKKSICRIFGIAVQIVVYQ